MSSTIAARLAREIGGFMYTRPERVRWVGGVVSFAFDDFPRSAWLRGGAILENYDLRATYYAALNLSGTTSELGAMFEFDDLRAAHANGHEIACHTYTHRDCSRATAEEILSEINGNAAALSRLLDGAEMTSFAYPHGAVSLAAKSALRDRFVSCRGEGHGINHGIVDMTDLSAVRLYDRSFDRNRLCRLIDDNQALGSWLIFYTHDVSRSPSDAGCTPEQLQSIVAHAAESGPVLPVREVLAGLGLAGAQSAARKAAA